MNKHYIIIPTSNVWNDQALIKQMRTHYIDKNKALKTAEELSRQYNIDFYVLECTDIVSTKVNIQSLGNPKVLSKKRT